MAWVAQQIKINTDVFAKATTSNILFSFPCEMCSYKMADSCAREGDKRSKRVTVFRHFCIAQLAIVGRTCSHIRERYHYYYCYYLGLMFILSMVCRSYLTSNTDIVEIF